MQKFTRKFRINNPYKPDEQYTQEVVVSDQVQYDYSDSPWVAIDTEYFNLDFAYSQLCLIQIASPDQEHQERQRVELIWVWESNKDDSNPAIRKAKESLAELLNRKDIEVIMHVSTADLPRVEKFAGVQYNGPLFDTKVAGKIALTNTSDHSMANLITMLVDPKFTKDKAQTSTQWDTEPTTWDEKALQYAMNDVIYLHPLKLALEKASVRRGNDALVAEVMDIMPVISHLYASGLTESVLRY